MSQSPSTESSPNYYGGEHCTTCRAPAARKVEEVIFDTDPGFGRRHPFTAYLCQACFDRVMGRPVHGTADWTAR